MSLILYFMSGICFMNGIALLISMEDETLLIVPAMLIIVGIVLILAVRGLDDEDK